MIHIYLFVYIVQCSSVLYLQVSGVAHSEVDVKVRVYLVQIAEQLEVNSDPWLLVQHEL